MTPIKNRMALARSSVARWMIPPAANWRRKSSGGLAHSGLLGPYGGLAISLAALATTSVASAYLTTPRLITVGLQLVLVATAAILVALSIRRIRNNLLEPLTHLRNWALRMRGGNLAARIPQLSVGEFADLARDINALGESLATLTRDMDAQVRKQTERLEQKSRTLEVLYDVAANINASRDLDELLTRFLHTLKRIVDAKAATVRLLNDSGELRLIAAVDMDNEVVERERYVSVSRCQCGSAAVHGIIQCQNVRTCGELNERPMFADENLEMVAVPIRYRDKNLGVYNLFVAQPRLVEREDIKDLLTSIGQHLGTAIEKSRLEHETRRLALMEERTLLANELHDSLAQTLASLRFQVQILEGNLIHAETRTAQDIENMKIGLDKANTELRQLLANFRTPMDERGVIPAIADLVDRLHKESGIATFFQNESKGLELPPSHEVQVLHIVQEALSNVRKHSKAKNARVLLRSDHQGHCTVIVEDDGQGMTVPFCSTQPGEHIGLAIMRERVSRLRGTLVIETEPDEGTRLEFSFYCPPSPSTATPLHDQRRTATR